MGNVWEAIKKHQAETSAKDKPSPSAPAASEPGAQRQADAPPKRKPAATPPRPAGGPPSGSDGRAKTNGYSELLTSLVDRGGPTTDEFRALRTNLLARCRGERFCYVMTSADPGEGKTVTAANLGVIMAERPERRTILVDFDMRKGRLASLFGAAQSPGMVDLLRGETRLEDVVQTDVAPNLSLIAGGEAKSSEVGELIARSEVEEIVMDLRRRYDYVIFDAPPMNEVSDAGILGRAVGNALLVVRLNRTRRESTEKAIRLLHAANVELAGIVLTHRKYYIPNYLYRYS